MPSANETTTWFHNSMTTYDNAAMQTTANAAKSAHLLLQFLIDRMIGAACDNSPLAHHARLTLCRFPYILALRTWTAANFFTFIQKKADASRHRPVKA